MTKQLHAYIHGTVQGVNFRATTRSQANALALSGYVKNLPDGRVEVLAEGAEDKLNKLLDFLREGPPAARVTAVKTEWNNPSHDYQGFQVAY
ncbi:MAG: acylphosphatase [Anaerolineales bacterium]